MINPKGLEALDQLIERIGEICLRRHERGFVMWPLMGGDEMKGDLRQAITAYLSAAHPAGDGLEVGHPEQAGQKRYLKDGPILRFVRLRFFRDLVQSERVKVYEAFGIDKGDLPSPLTLGIEQQVFDQLFARSPAAIDAALSAERARVEELTRERDEAFAANERDRSIIASARNAFNDAFQRRSWLLEGRGSYEWDDDRWRDEFAEAIKELSAPLDVLAKIGIDWSLCPVTPEEIAAARIDWKSRADAAESEVKRLREALEKIACPSQTEGLLWWQVEARAALTKEGGNGE